MTFGFLLGSKANFPFISLTISDWANHEAPGKFTPLLTLVTCSYQRSRNLYQTTSEANYFWIILLKESVNSLCCLSNSGWILCLSCNRKTYSKLKSLSGKKRKETNLPSWCLSSSYHFTLFLFITTVVENVMFAWSLQFLFSHLLDNPLVSASHPHHCTETAIHKDISGLP